MIPTRKVTAKACRRTVKRRRRRARSRAAEAPLGRDAGWGGADSRSLFRRPMSVSKARTLSAGEAFFVGLRKAAHSMPSATSSNQLSAVPPSPCGPCRNHKMWASAGR